MIDALASEPQYLHHLLPVWRALPSKGRLITDERGDADRLLVASYSDIRRGRRLGYERFVFLEHGIGQSYGGDPRSPHRDNPSYSGGRDRRDVELFLVPGPHPAARWRAAYPHARVEVVGSPRLDDLPARQPGPTTIAISFHWPAHMSPEHATALPDFGPALPALGQRFRVIGHQHPRWAVQRRSLARRYAEAGIEFVEDFDDVCRRADVYVCDNSSTIFEFASTGRPVVLMNARGYRRHIEHGLRFWEAAHVGIMADQPGELIPMIEWVLTDPLPDDREEALSLVYAYRSGGAARAAEVIADHLGLREAA